MTLTSTSFASSAKASLRSVTMSSRFVPKGYVALGELSVRDLQPGDWIEVLHETLHGVRYHGYVESVGAPDHARRQVLTLRPAVGDQFTVTRRSTDRIEVWRPASG